MRPFSWDGPVGFAAFVFDNDGTLVDSESTWFEAYTRLLAAHGIEHVFEVQRRMMGLSPRDCASALQREYPGLPQGASALEALLIERGAAYREARAALGVRPLPGVERFLRWARERAVPMALATSATREEIVLQNRMLGWEGLFETIVTADDIKRHKPAPDAYLEAARRLGLAPARCLAFEDAANGLRSAHAAGMPVVFVRDARFRMESPVETEGEVAGFDELLAAGR